MRSLQPRKRHSPTILTPFKTMNNKYLLFISNHSIFSGGILEGLSHLLRKLFFFSSFVEIIIDIQHCVSLRCTAQ